MVIVPHHVYLALSDLEKEIEEEKEHAKDKGMDDNLENPEDHIFWAGYFAGMSVALNTVKKFIDSL